MSKEVIKPWGSYEVRDTVDDSVQTKILTVTPGNRLSYQYHNHRDEVWVVVSGTGTVFTEEGATSIEKDDIVVIHREVNHSVKCTSSENLIIHETWVGSGTSEEDIVRLNDAYGREVTHEG